MGRQRKERGRQSVQLVISAYLVPGAGLVLLMVLIAVNPLFNKRETTYFMVAAIVNMLLIVATSVDYLCAGQPDELFVLLRRATSFLNFGLSPFIPLSLLRVFERKKARWYVFLPLAVNLVLSFTSMFNGAVFYITEENTYSRGSLFFVPLTVSLLYMVLLIVQPEKKMSMQGKRLERLLLWGVIVLLLGSVVLEMSFRFHFMNYGCSALSLIMYYLLLNIQGFTVDPLTGAFNRIAYNRALDSIKGSAGCVIALVDINGFKAVNDNFGHDEGDRFLVRFTLELGDRMRTVARLYRIGGDEFVLLSKKCPPEEFGSRMEKVRGELLKQGMSFAYGVVGYGPMDDMETTLKQADSLMYADKRAVKEAQGAE